MPKLPKGMTRRPNGSYVTRDRRGGKDRWITLGRDRDEACRRYREYQRDRDQFTVRPGATVEQLARAWLSAYIAIARTEDGQKLARSWVRKYLLPELGPIPAERVRAGHLRRYRLALEEKHLSPETVAHILSDARCMFRWAHEENHIGSYPVPRKLLPRIPKRFPKVLTAQEQRTLKSLPDPYGFLVRLGLATGLRWGDLTRARREHVRDGKLEVEVGKTGQTLRVPLTPEIAGEIRNRLGPLVLFSAKSKGSVTRMIRRMSGVQRFHLHMMRHTCATELLRNGWPISGVQRFLGHKSVTTTERYAQFDDAMMEREAEVRWGACGDSGGKR